MFIVTDLVSLSNDIANCYITEKMIIETNVIQLFVFHCRDAIGQFCNDPSYSDTVNPASNHHNTFVHEMFQVTHADRQNVCVTRHIGQESLY